MLKNQNSSKALLLRNFEGLRLRRVVYEGDPEAQIAAFAQAEDVQLIVMPTHGYGVFRRYLIGSVTAKVLHDVSCPVLTGAHIDRRDRREMQASQELFVRWIWLRIL